MKPLTDTNYEHTIPTKYFFARVLEMKKTQMGHHFIQCDNVEEVEMHNGVKVCKRELGESNFVIPKRRLGIITEVESKVKYKQHYFFKLQEESRSKKYMVSEVFTV